MNTATEVKLEGDPERGATDRRRRMTLVVSGKRPDPKRRFSITVSQEIFSAGAPGGKAAVSRTPHAKEISAERMRESATDEPNTRQADHASRKLITVAAGIAALSAIALGYFIGRRRD